MKQYKRTRGEGIFRALLDDFRYAVIDLGNLRDGGLIHQAGGPLAGRELFKGER